MLEKTVELKKIYNKEDDIENNRTNSISKIIIFSLFSFLFILSLLSIQWLYEYRYIFTIRLYINSHISIYFPIQVSSFILYFLNFILIIIISIPSNYFIIKIIINLIKKDNSEHFDKLPKLIFLPIIINLFLFSLSKFIFKYHYIINYFYYIGFLLCFISCLSLIKINLDKIIIDNYFNFNYENDFIKFFFEDVFFEALLGFNIYYLFYTLCQIIRSFIYDLNIDNYLGIVANIFFGLICLYIIFAIKSFVMPILNFIIFLGIFHFQFTIRKEEREEINLGNGEMILSLVFLLCCFFEFLCVDIYKYQNIN